MLIDIFVAFECAEERKPNSRDYISHLCFLAELGSIAVLPGTV